MTWQVACENWLNASDRSASDGYSLDALNREYIDRPLTECTRESFDEALTGKKPATFNRYRAIIQAILHHAGVNIKIPLRKVKSQRLRFLSEEEWQRLYVALPATLKPLAAFSIATGLRQHNVTHLTWQQLDLQRKVAWIHADQAKAAKPIGIPLSDPAIEILRAQIGKHEQWVFPYKGRGRSKENEKFKGKPISKIKTAWQMAMERAGLGYFERVIDADGRLISKKWHGDFTWHGLRHTWAAWHVMSGTPLNVLQKLGGWADVKMVQQYAHLAPEYLAGYANNAKPWNAEQAVA
ncbi:MAG: site-specific integrase [Georgfuchsia sp.]